MRNFHSLLLAAGKGTRAGGPKIWRDQGGRTMIERQLDFLLHLFVPENVVVSVQQDWLTRCRQVNPHVRWTAVDPSASPLASLQELLKALPPGQGFFLHHIDMPVFDREVFAALARAASQDAAAGAAVPVHGGRRGHPVFIKAAEVSSVLRLDPARDRLDHWLRTRKAVEVEVAFAGIHENLNNAENI